jgi:hypothetical protein
MTLKQLSSPLAVKLDQPIPNTPKLVLQQHPAEVAKSLSIGFEMMSNVGILKGGLDGIG